MTVKICLPTAKLLEEETAMKTRSKIEKRWRLPVDSYVDDNLLKITVLAGTHTFMVLPLGALSDSKNEELTKIPCDSVRERRMTISI